MRRLLLLTGVLLFAFVLASCGERDHAAATGAGSTPPASSAAPGAGDSAAAFAATTPLENITSTGVLALAADGRARVTLVNVWATWCDPCREEFPELLEAARAHRADGVRLVLVSTDFDGEQPGVHRFLAKRGVTDTTYFKHEGDQPFIDTLNPQWTGAIPATLVYDSAGRRVAFWEGRADRARFEAAIQKALGANTPPAKGAHS